ncbi:hypothetical protein BDR07DRAFT_1504479 [Suillus spraguei]|nr:hypothetical protein BDR07DRAFT_1504479 [Suillus spraguei]
MKPCLDCGAIHREIFAFPRPEKGRYKGREWELLVKPLSRNGVNLYRNTMLELSFVTPSEGVNGKPYTLLLISR